MHVDQGHIDAYRRDGAVLINGLFADWVDVITAGIERNMAHPGPYASENLHEGEAGRFFDDYCNWTVIPEFEDVIRNSPAAAVAAELMQSDRRADLPRPRSGQGTGHDQTDTLASGFAVLLRRR